MELKTVKKAIEQGRTAEDSKSGGHSGGGVVLSILLTLAMRPVTLLSRLIQDERRLAKYNRTVIPAGAQQKPDRKRVLTIWSLVAGAVSVGLCLPALYFGFLNDGAGLSQTLKLIGDGRFRAVWSLGLPGHPFFWLFPVGFIVAANIAHLLHFHAPWGRYFKMFHALRAGGGVLNSEALVEPWYYPGKALYLDLVSSKPQEVLDREGMWRNAGFKPLDEAFQAVDSTNEWLFVAGALKPTNETFFPERYEEWNKYVEDPKNVLAWNLGEYVRANGSYLADCFQDFSLAFIGTSGAGKTEAMKFFLMAFKCKHPLSRLTIVDLKATSDWAVFAPTTEPGTIVTRKEDALLALMYYDALMYFRGAIMKERGYNGIRAWIADRPDEWRLSQPALLVIDEFPQLSSDGGPLKFESRSGIDGQPANALFKMMTLGRSFGLWFILGSQFGTSEAIPSAIKRNIQTGVMLRVQSEGEAMNWTGCSGPAEIGKGKRTPSGKSDKQPGYGYVGSKEGYVRFWFTPDFYIVHEMKRFGVPTRRGHTHLKLMAPVIPPGYGDLLKAVNNDRTKLHWYEQGRISAYEKAAAKFSESMRKLDESPHEQIASKAFDPMLPIWEDGETVEAYCRRVRTAAIEKLAEMFDKPSEYFAKSIPLPEVKDAANGGGGYGGYGRSRDYGEGMQPMSGSGRSAPTPVRPSAQVPARQAASSVASRLAAPTIKADVETSKKPGEGVPATDGPKPEAKVSQTGPRRKRTDRTSKSVLPPLAAKEKEPNEKDDDDLFSKLLS